MANDINIKNGRLNTAIYTWWAGRVQSKTPHYNTKHAPNTPSLPKTETVTGVNHKRQFLHGSVTQSKHADSFSFMHDYITFFTVRWVRVCYGYFLFSVDPKRAVLACWVGDRKRAREIVRCVKHLTYDLCVVVVVVDQRVQADSHKENREPQIWLVGCKAANLAPSSKHACFWWHFVGFRHPRNIRYFSQSLMAFIISRRLTTISPHYIVSLYQRPTDMLVSHTRRGDSVS